MAANYPPLIRPVPYYAAPSGTVIDLCAGIGMLTYYVRQHDICGGGASITRMVALELDHEFVEIGRKILPEVEWIEGSVFDLDLLRTLGEFDVAISNPPFGQMSVDAKWLSFKGPAHLMVAEIAIRIAYAGGLFIIPSQDTQYNVKKREHQESTNFRRFRNCFPSVSIQPVANDMDYYKSMWQGAAPDVCIADIEASEKIYHLTKAIQFAELETV